MDDATLEAAPGVTARGVCFYGGCGTVPWMTPRLTPDLGATARGVCFTYASVDTAANLLGATRTNQRSTWRGGRWPAVPARAAAAAAAAATILARALLPAAAARAERDVRIDAELGLGAFDSPALVVKRPDSRVPCHRSRPSEREAASRR